MSSVYGPAPLTPGQMTTVTVPNQGVSAVVITNESPYTLRVSIDGTSIVRWVHAFSANLVQMPTGYTGNILFSPVEVLNNASLAPAYSVLVEAFGHGEEPGVGYPFSLTRISNVGNTIPLGTNTQQVINDGNTPNTPVVEATASGTTGGSNVLIDNSGNVTFADFVSAVRTVLFAIQAGQGITIGSANRFVKIEPGAIRGGSGGIGLGNTSTGRDVLDATPANTYLKGPNTVQFQVPDGTTRVMVSSSGLTINSGGLALTGSGRINFSTGFLTRVSTFTGTGTGTYPHNNNGTPFIVLVETTAPGGSQTTGVSNITDTSVQVTCGAGMSFKALALG